MTTEAEKRLEELAKYIEVNGVSNYTLDELDASNIREVLRMLQEARKDSERMANAVNGAKALLFDLMQYPKAGMYPDGPCLARSDWQEVRNVSAKIAAVDQARGAQPLQAVMAVNNLSHEDKPRAISGAM